MIWRKFPYTNFHEMNMDQLITVVRQMVDEWVEYNEKWEKLYHDIDTAFAAFKAEFDEFIADKDAEFKQFVADLDIDAEFRKALDSIIADGTFASIVNPVIINKTEQWLTEHITQPTTPVVDSSLSIAGAAADAAATGQVKASTGAYVGIHPDDKITFDYVNAKINFPNGFVVFNNQSRGFSAQELTLPNSSASAWTLHYNNTTRQFFGTVFNTGSVANSDGVVGLVYRDRIWINGINPENILTTGSLYVMPESGEAEYITYGFINYWANKQQINFPQGFLAIRSLTRPVPQQVVDLPVSQYDAWLIKAHVNYDQNNNVTIYGEEYGVQRQNNDPVIGAIYGERFYVNGYHSTNAPGVVSIRANGDPNYSGNGVIVYDFTEKKIKVDVGGYVLTSTGSRININIQELDLSQVETQYNAWRIYLKSDGDLVARAWNSTEPHEGLTLIALTYGRSLSMVASNPIPVLTKVLNIKIFGDSLVAGTNAVNIFHLIWARRNNQIIYNYGVGSTGYAVPTTSNVIAGNGVVGKGEATAESGNNTVIDMINAQDTIEAGIIMAGTNDYGSSIPEATFRTAVSNTIDALKSKTNFVYVITPVHRSNEDANSVGMTLADYSTIIKEVCTAKNVKYFDGFEIPLDVNTRPDGLHPNEAGHSLIAAYIEQDLMKVIPMC